MKIIYHGKMRRLEFTLAEGDIFDASVEAIINSEQSDFVLAHNTQSISGQIRRRYGSSIQKELDAATGGKSLRAGTVLSTSGGTDFRRIYHAGFHEPDEWQGERDSSDHGDFLETIGLCIDQVLQRALADGLHSLAFPLIGCGIFGLDEKMLVLQFLDALEGFDRRLLDSDAVHVWLVIRDSQQTTSVVSKLIELLVEFRQDTSALSLEPVGVPVLDLFATSLSRRSHQTWMKWQLCRFAEVALDFVCFGLCRAARPPVGPRSAFQEGKGLVFGTVLKLATELTNNEPALDKKAWGVTLFSSLLRDCNSKNALQGVVVQRNHLAHGRFAEALVLPDLEKLVRRGLRLNDWPKIPNECGPLDIGLWEPWIHVSPKTGENGLLEEWSTKSVRYVVPHTGERFTPTTLPQGMG